MEVVKAASSDQSARDKESKATTKTRLTKQIYTACGLAKMNREREMYTSVHFLDIISPIGGNCKDACFLVFFKSRASMRTLHRSGKIAGLMVILLLLILIPTWAFGHWLAGSYPVASSAATADDAGFESSEADANSALGGSLTDANPGVDGFALGEPGTATSRSGGSETKSHDQTASGDANAPASNTGHADAVDPALARQNAANEAAAKAAEAKVVEANQEIAALKQQLTTISSQRDQLKLQVDSAATQTDQAKQAATQWDQERQKLMGQLSQHEQQITDLNQKLQASNAVVRQPTADPVAATPKASRTRSWTASTGQVVKATFVRVEGDTVLLESKGSLFRIPISRLAAADQAIVGQLSGQ